MKQVMVWNLIWGRKGLLDVIVISVQAVEAHLMTPQAAVVIGALCILMMSGLEEAAPLRK